MSLYIISIFVKLYLFYYNFLVTDAFTQSTNQISYLLFTDWQTLKLEIVNVWMQDNYGSADIIPVKDYLKVKL